MSAHQRLRPLIVPVFLPNIGCPFPCIYCDQKKITGEGGDLLDPTRLAALLDEATRHKDFYRHPLREVAFYGGTFTGLPLPRIRALLGTVRPYLESGAFSALRVSTRPDRVGGEILRELRDGGVTLVELGAQSMDDTVLARAGRGHTARDTREALSRLRSLGLGVGLQLMPGLPGDSAEVFRTTVRESIALAPQAVRLYPVLVLRDTPLAELHREGTYRPLPLEEAVTWCAEALGAFEEAGIPVIRMGLLGTDALLRPGVIVDGPWHPAFGSLVRTARFRETVAPFLPAPGQTGAFTLFARPEEISLLRGHNNDGISWVQMRTGSRGVRLAPDPLLPPGRIRIGPP